MSKKPGPCCDTENTWFGPMIVMPQGKSPVAKAGRKVYHRRGGTHDGTDYDPLVIQPLFHCEFCSTTHDGDCPAEVFWHWFDQRHKLADGYGP